jgi:hypothetical protein
VVIILACVASVVGLLAIPFDFTFDLHARDGGKSRARIAWLWGGFGVELRRAQQSRTPSVKRRRSVPLHKVRAALLTRGFVAELKRFARRLVGCLHVHELRAAIDFGLDDPADTGTLFGFFEAERALFPLPAPMELSVRPDFQNADLRLAATGQLRLIPLELVLVTLRFALTASTLRAALAMARA